MREKKRERGYTRARERGKERGSEEERGGKMLGPPWGRTGCTWHHYNVTEPGNEHLFSAGPLWRHSHHPGQRCWLCRCPGWPSSSSASRWNAPQLSSAWKDTGQSVKLCPESYRICLHVSAQCMHIGIIGSNLLHYHNVNKVHQHECERFPPRENSR